MFTDAPTTANNSTQPAACECRRDSHSCPARPFTEQLQHVGPACTTAHATHLDIGTGNGVSNVPHHGLVIAQETHNLNTEHVSIQLAHCRSGVVPTRTWPFPGPGYSFVVMTCTMEQVETEIHGDAWPLLPPSFNSASADVHVVHVPLLD